MGEGGQHSHGGGSIVVTGAAGFIGSHVCEALVRAGRRVVGVDNFDPFYPESIKRRNLLSVERSARDQREGGSFELAECDVCDGESLGPVFERARAEGVIHLAARAGVRPSIEDPAGYVRANVLGTQVVLDAARRAGCARVVVASSSSVYGNNRKVPFSEEDDVSAPISPYAATKRACELMAHSHWHLTGMAVSCLRFFTVYGPRQRPDLAIGSFLARVSEGQEIAMFGDGSTSRDYTYVDDIARGVISAYQRSAEHGYRIWNLGGSSPTTLRELIATIGRVVGKEARVRATQPRAGDVERTYADVTRSRAELGYSPRVSLEEGIARQWAWMRGEGGAG